MPLVLKSDGAFKLDSYWSKRFPEAASAVSGGQQYPFKQASQSRCGEQFFADFFMQYSAAFGNP
jgi:hypothetical protein